MPVRFWWTGILLALAGSIWSALGQASCDACKDAASLIGGHGLGWAGVAYYGALIAWGYFRQPMERVGIWATFAAAGAHIILVTLLFKAKLLCLPCATAATGALLAASACVFRREFRGAPEAWPLPVLALVVLSLVLSMQAARSREYARIGNRLLTAVLAEHQPQAPGRVRLVLYERAGCRHCADFERTCLPRLKAAFGGTLLVEKRAAPDGIPTPTAIVLGGHPAFVVGLQPCRILRRLLGRAVGSLRGEARR